MIYLPNIAIFLRWLCVSCSALIVKGFQFKVVSTAKTRDQLRQRAFGWAYFRSLE
jgi:hypothetical protein